MFKKDFKLESNQKSAQVNAEKLEKLSCIYDYRFSFYNENASGIAIRDALMSTDKKAALLAFTSRPKEELSLTLGIIAFAGHLDVLKEVIETNKIKREMFSPRSGFRVMQLAVLGGCMDVVEYMNAFLGKLNDLKTDEDDYYDTTEDDEPGPQHSNSKRWANLNCLLLYAIMSVNKKEMVPYVSRHFVSDESMPVSFRFAMRCILEALISKDLLIMQMISKHSFLKICGAGSGSDIHPLFKFRAEDEVFKAMVYIAKHWNVDEDKWFYKSYVLPLLVTLGQPEVRAEYDVCIHEGILERDLKEGEKLRKALSLELDKKMIEQICHDYINKVAILDSIFKLGSVNPAECYPVYQNSLADWAAQKGALETLQRALTVWNVSFNQSDFKQRASESRYSSRRIEWSLLDKTYPTIPNGWHDDSDNIYEYGILYQAAISKNPKIFEFLMDYLVERFPWADFSKIKWQKLIDIATGESDGKNMEVPNSIMKCKDKYKQHLGDKKEEGSKLLLKK